MRFPTLALLLTAAWSTGTAACSSGATSADPSGNDASSSTGDGAAASGDGAAASGDDASGASDAPADAPHDACVLWVDDAGVTHGCGSGGHGPGDKDDGGGLPAPPPPDASPDASDLPFGAQCLDNAQCTSDLCFDYAVKGQFCTQLCEASADCPDASLGCNGMGVCRAGN
jgi:hypothetical protein